MENVMRIAAQIEKVDKSISHKTHKGISFILRKGNRVEYVNIPSVFAQRLSSINKPAIQKPLVRKPVLIEEELESLTESSKEVEEILI